MNDFYLIYKNLTRKPLRLILSCFAIFIAFLIFGAVTSLKVVLNSGIELAADNRLVVFNSINFTSPLPIAYTNKVRAIDGVDKVTHANWFGGYFQEPRNQLVVMAVDPESYLSVYEEIVLPPENKANWLQDQQGILVGERIATSNNWKVGDRIPVSSNIFSHKDGGHTWNFVISGIFTGSDEQFDAGFLIFHYDYFKETRTFGGDNIGWLVLTTTDTQLNEQIAKTIDDTFANSQAETDTSTEKAFNKAFIEQIGNIGLIIFGVVFMAFFTILVMVGNTMALAIRERRKEIAVLKTLGFPSIRIFKMVLGESMFLSLLGGFLGLTAAFFIVKVFSIQMARYLPNLILSKEIALQAVGYMVLLGLITGIIPAINALKLTIVTALGED